MGPLLALGYQFPFPRRGPRNGSSREPVENISKLQDRFPCAGVGQLPSHLLGLFGAAKPLQGFMND